MNDDEPSTAGDAPPQSSSGEIDIDDGQKVRAALRAQRARKRKLYCGRKGDMLDDLIRGLDILTYAEMSCLYYMDNASMRLWLRIAVQFIYLTPKPAVLPEQPKPRRFLAALLLVNAVCIFLHLMFAPAEAGEPTRGYLHGGLYLDFVGQKAPVSRLRLLMMDLIITALQIVTYALSLERRKLREDSVTESTPAAPSTAQDHDHEERGVQRGDLEAGEGESFEMQPLNPSPNSHSISRPVSAGADDQGDRPELSRPTPSPTDAQIYDAFNSGQMVICEMAIRETLAEGLRPNTAAETEANRSARAALIGNLPGRSGTFRLSVRIRRGQ